LGSSTCSNCSAGQYSTATAAVNSSTCIACLPGLYA
jgi:hypothetical protein